MAKQSKTARELKDIVAARHSWWGRTVTSRRGLVLGKFEKNPSTGVSPRAVTLRIVFHTLGQ
jgi:hypothetical protein